MTALAWLSILASDAAAVSGGVLAWGGVAAALLASAGVAARIWQSESQGGEVVPGREWPAAEWSGAGVLLIACGWLLVVSFCVSLFPADAPLLDRMAAHAAGSIIATFCPTPQASRAIFAISASSTGNTSPRSPAFTAE